MSCSSGAAPALDKRPDEWMVEEYIAAPSFHIDGMTGHGHVLHCRPSAYTTGNARALREGQYLVSSMLAPNDPRTDALIAFTADVHAALPAPTHHIGLAAYRQFRRPLVARTVTAHHHRQVAAHTRWKCRTRSAGCPPWNGDRG
ncbi:hypothetical protein GCM10029978_047500 [Actinoallomurus acanthiterrae]